VLVPGIAFTAQGYRVGFGGGYFDRFLAGFPGVSIGLAFDLQMTAEFSPDAHDVPVQWIVTEAGTHLCSA
jgi:5-formyltetrahydrofolate cyclo-ligase